MIAKDTQSNLCVMQVLPALISGGVERGTVDIAQALIKKSHQAIVVSSGGPMVAQLEQLGVLHITLPVHSKNPLTIKRNAGRLKQLIIDHKVDVIHARSRAPAWSCFWAARATNTPFMTTFHGAYGHQNCLKRRYNSVMLKSATTIAVSNFIAQHITEIYPSHPQHIQVIPRGIDTQLFSPSNTLNDRADILRKKWRIPTNKTVIMLPGRLTRLKGHTILIKALSQLPDSNFICLFVGDCHGSARYQQELETVINQYHLEKVIFLTGGCDDMAAAYHLANIVVSASTKPESFGRVTCEAQVMDCLVVATNHGGTKEVLAPSQQCFLCEPNNTDSMTQALKKALTTDKQVLNTIYKESRKYIEANFTLDKMCQATLAIYQNAAKTSPDET